MTNIPFGMLFSAFEVSCQGLACIVNRSRNKSICLGIEECRRGPFRWLWGFSGVNHFMQKIACGSWHMLTFLILHSYGVFSQIRVMSLASPASCATVGREPHTRQGKVSICATRITFWGAGQRGTVFVAVSAQVLLIVTAMLHWVWWFMKLMIDDYP